MNVTSDDHATLEGVNILDPRMLLEFAQDTTPEGRSRLARAVSHFFQEQDLNQTEQRIASDIMLNLLRQAEVDLRQALAERLANHASAPHELIVFLANDEITVAEPVLLHSPLLSDIDLMYIVAIKGKTHARTVAERADLSPMVANKLIDTRDPAVIRTLVDNQRVTLQKSSMKKLARVALVSEEIQAPLLRRPEVDSDVAVDLYMVVSQALRRQIVSKFKLQTHLVEQAIDGLVQELSNEARGVREVTAEMIALAQRMRESGDISADLMIRTLRRGQISFFVALFAARMELQPAQVTSMIQRDGGRGFVIACRSINMLKSEFASIFLLSRGIRSGDKIVDQRELAMALKQFDALREHDSERLLRQWVRAHLADA